MAALKLYSKEKWILLPFSKSPNGLRYVLTNYGRVISYTNTPKEGTLLKHSFISGYPALNFRLKDGRKTFLVHRLVAKYFVKKPGSRHRYVLHVNHKKEDNYERNLKWATLEEKNRHIIKERQESEMGNYKLTAARVRLIKQKLLKGKVSLKDIANQYGVSDMQIHRIKTGENWSYIKV
jgi:Trp operon repressor